MNKATPVSAFDAKAAYPEPARAWFAVAVLLLALTVAFVDRQILSLMVQPVRASLGLSDTEISLLHGFAFAIFYTVLGIPLGRWADRRTRTRMIIAGILIWSVATIACGYAGNFTELFAARVVVGIGEATLSPAAYSLIADMFPPARRGRPTAVYSMGIVAGTGLALIAGGHAVSFASGTVGLNPWGLGPFQPWQLAFVIVGLPGFAVAGLMLLIREPARQEVVKADASLRDAWAYLKPRSAILAQITCGLALGGGVVAFSFGAWLPTTFVRLHHWAPTTIATAMGISILTFGIGGAILGGVIGDRRLASGAPDGALQTAAFGMAMIVPAAPIVALAGDPYLALAAYCWINLWIGLPTALAIPIQHALIPNEYRGVATAFYLFVANMLGFAIGPTMVAVMTDKVFADDLAVGQSLAIMTTLSSLAGFALLRSTRTRYLEHMLPNRRER